MSDVPIIKHVVINVVAGGAAPEAFDFSRVALVHELAATAFEGRLAGPFSSLASAEEEGLTAALFPALHADLTEGFAQQAALGGVTGVGEIRVVRKLPAQEQIGQCLVYDASGGTYTDETADINDVGAGDVTLFPAVEEDELDFVVFGHVLRFGAITFDSTGGTAGTDGAVAWEYGSDADGDGVIDTWGALSTVSDGTTGFKTAAGAGQALTFDIPNDWDAGVVDPDDLDVEPPRFYIRARVTTVYTVNPVYSSAFIPGDADYSDALSAVVALEGADAFFGFKVYDRTDAAITDVTAWAEAQPLKLFVPQTRSSAMRAGTASNIGEDLRLAGYRKSALVYERLDTAHLDTAWLCRCLGKNPDAPRGKCNWKFRQLVHAAGPASHLTETEQDNIKTENANFYGTTYGRTFMQEGTVASGEFVDNVVSELWLGRRLEEKAIAMFTDFDILGFDQTGLAIIEAGFSEVFGQWTDNGHGSTDPDAAPTIDMPKSRDISSATKQTRILTFSGECTHRNGINKIIFTVNVKF